MRVRYALADLEKAAGTNNTEQRNQPMPDTALATRLGLTRDQIVSARRRGLSIEQADRWAVLAGFHPANVWDTWCRDALEEDRCRYCSNEIGLESKYTCGTRKCRLTRRNRAKAAQRARLPPQKYNNSMVP